MRGVSGARLEPAEVLARRDTFTHDWKDDGQVEWLNGAKIDLVRGHGRLAGERVVSVGDVTLTARQAVVIATGTDALVPPALARVKAWTSREATSAKSVPSRLAIVGGGVVGCEMAAAWSALGSQVTLVSQGELLDRLPAFAGVARRRRAPRRWRRRARRRERQRRDAGGRGRPGHAGAWRRDAVTADEVLAATGRTPRTGDIGLATVGLEDGSWLSVDDTMRVTAVAGGWLYAAGDVNHLALLTHMGKYQARVCGDAIAARAAGREPPVRDLASKTRVPQVVFTIPEVAAVGLTAEQATAAGLRVRVVEYEIGNVAGARLFADDYQGRAQMVVDEDRKVIVGLTLAGPGTGEMIHAATIAVVGEVPLDRLWHAVPSYPTMSEVWLRLLETYGL